MPRCEGQEALDYADSNNNIDSMLLKKKTCWWNKEFEVGHDADCCLSDSLHI